MKNNKEFNIMIIEDDMIYGKTLEHYIAKHYTVNVERFTSGKDALCKLCQKEYYPDLILLDYHLGDLTGDEIIASLTTLDKQTKVIILSSQTDSDVVHFLFKQHIYEYLTKGDYVIKNLSQSIPQLIDNKDKGLYANTLSF